MECGVQQRHSYEETGTGHPGVGMGTVSRPGFPAQVAVHGCSELRGACSTHYQHNRC